MRSIPSSRENKAVFASIQASRSAILKLHEIRDSKEKIWIDNFLDQITLEPDKVKNKKGPWEKGIAKASDALGLGRNLKFTTAIAEIREEIYAYGTDAWNKRYYDQLVLIVLRIFHDELAWAIHLYKLKQDIKDWIDTKYVARATNILEEARVTEFMEDEEYE